MTITIDSANRIAIDNLQTGLAVTQSGKGTIVYAPEGLGTKYAEYPMPHVRYSLSHEKPASGVAGRSQFEHDIIEILKNK